MSFTNREIGGYTGKEIELHVKPAVDEDGASYVANALTQIRGAQNFNPTQEKSETKVNEMGYAAQKTIYGTVNYTVATTLMFRDLLQIARMGGVSVNAKILNVDKFNKVNAVNYVRDPDSKAIIATIFSLGYKARTANKTQAVEANSQVTMDGAADIVIECEGQAKVRQYDSNISSKTCKVDGINACFIIDSTIGAALTNVNVLAVENPAGNLMNVDSWDGITFGVYLASDGISSVIFTTPPVVGTIVRIIYKIA